MNKTKFVINFIFAIILEFIYSSINYKVNALGGWGPIHYSNCKIIDGSLFPCNGDKIQAIAFLIGFSILFGIMLNAAIKDYKSKKKNQTNNSDKK